MLERLRKEVFRPCCSTCPSTLLYGAPPMVQDFLALARELMAGPLPLVTLAEASDAMSFKSLLHLITLTLFVILFAYMYYIIYIKLIIYNSVYVNIQSEREEES